MGKKISKKKIIVSLFFALLCFPLFELVMPFKSCAGLTNFNISRSAGDFTLKSWFNGDFQNSCAKYLNDNLGLNPFFVRLRNEIDIDLFNELHSNMVFIGKDKYLFEEMYVNEYYGKDYLGDSLLDDYVSNLKELQDSLNNKGKLMLFCLAPGKATFYPELVPKGIPNDKRNSVRILEEFKKNNINHIDLSTWLKSKRKFDGNDHLLYPRFGIHWSYYSSMLAVDTITKYIDSKVDCELPKFSFTKMNLSEETKYFDEDLAGSLNLLVDIKSPPMMYPEHTWTKKKSKTKKVLLIGDSFSWDIVLRSRVNNECFDSLQFHFYNRVVYRPNEKGVSILSRHLELKESLEYFDIVMFLFTEPNLKDFGCSFIEDALETLKDSTFVCENRSNEKLREKCLWDKVWNDDLKNKANERNISLDSMINIYLFDDNYQPY